MRWTVVAVGKAKESYFREAAATYLARLNHYRSVNLVEIAPREVLRHGAGDLRVALDEHGELLDTRGLAGKLATFEQRGERGITFILGGPDGLTPEELASCSWRLSLSPMTLPYQLARVVLLEQLYRCESLRKGEPYHHD